MKISKTRINKRMREKTNSILVDTIFLAKKNGHLELAKKLAVPTKQRRIMNLTELNEVKEDKIIVPGKILGSGDIEKKLNIYALSYSEQAKEKLQKSGSVIKTIKQGLEENKLSGYKII